MNIQLYSEFKIHENIVIPLSREVREEQVQPYFVSEETVSAFGPLQDIEVRAYNEQYVLYIYHQPGLAGGHAINTAYVEEVLQVLAPFVADTHFVIYNRSYDLDTYYDVAFTEIKINNGQYSSTRPTFKEAIPGSRFLDLGMGGVQQCFDFPEEFLFACGHWKTDPSIRDFLVSGMLHRMEIALWQRGTHATHSPIDYAMAFNLTKEIERLVTLHQPQSLPQKIQKVVDNIIACQAKDRKLILQLIQEKAVDSKTKVDLRVIKAAEKKLGVTFPLTFQERYTTIGNGGANLAYTFLPIDRMVWITGKLRSQYTGFPNYLIPFAYQGNSRYSCLDTSKMNFPVVMVDRKQVLTATPWYDAFVQTYNSFEELLDDKYKTFGSS